MLFFLGFIVGLLLTAMFFLTMIALHIAQNAKDSAGQIMRESLAILAPAEEGFIIEPEDENDIARQEHIDQNRREGRDTKISELL